MSERLIPYQPMDLAEPADLVAAIRQRRGGQFINLDRMLLHSVPIAEGWNHFIGEIRNNLSLDPKLRELAMCGVAVLNGAEYEFFHHAPPFKKAGGTEEQVQGLRLIGQATFPKNLFSPVENDAADLTFQMTRNIKVDPELMKRLQKALGSTDTVELVTARNQFNRISTSQCFLQALH